MLPLHYTDFNDLYVIAIGLSLAYVVIQRNTNKTFSFLCFLDNMAQGFYERCLKKKSKPQQEEIDFMTNVKYYLDSKLLDEKTEGALELIYQKANETLNGIRVIEQELRQKMERHTRTNFLSVGAFDCAFYGICLLFLGPLSLKSGLHIDWWVCGMNLLLSLFLIRCIVCDRRSNSRLKPTIFCHALCFIVVGVLLLILDNVILDPLCPGYRKGNIIAAPILCFGNFIIYFFISLCGSFYQTSVTRLKIRHMKLDKVTDEHKQDLGRYRKELNEKNLQLMNLADHTPNAISFAAETSQTL